MTRWTLGLILAGLAVGSAAAQYPAGGFPAYGYAAPGPVPPAVAANPAFGTAPTPPLSPYLNFLRGGNPAINYYYGVRPWEAANAAQQAAAQAAPPVGFSQARNGFLPAAGFPTDVPVETSAAGQPATLSPSGHAVVYGNRFGTMAGGFPGGAATRLGSPTGSQPGFFGSKPPAAFNRGNPTAGGRAQPGATIPRIN